MTEPRALPETLSLIRDLALAPGRAAERLRAPEGLAPALRIYVAYLAVSVAFYTWKPVDFPAPSPLPGSAAVPAGPVFWAKVQAWNPLVTALWVAFLGWYSRFLNGGRLAARLLPAAAAAAGPVLLIVLYTMNSVPRAGLAAGWGILIVAMTPLWRARPPESWRPLVALAASITAVNLLLALPFSAAVAAGSAPAYHALEMAMLAWTLGLGSVLLGRLEGLPTPRAFAALFLSMLSQLLLVITLYFLGVLPKDVLKALMTV